MKLSGRSRTWWEVWNRREPKIVEFNGTERCFDDFESYRAFVENEAAFVRESLRLGAADSVLDLGCGTGILASFIAPHVGSIVALDYSEHALEVARTKHSAANVDYRRGDLTEVAPADFDANKAYAVGVFHYLDSYESARNLLQRLTENGMEVVVVDVPDVEAQDRVERHYDMDTYSHLYFDEARLNADFDGVTVHRGLFPEYSNDAVRFSFHVPASPS